MSFDIKFNIKIAYSGNRMGCLFCYKYRIFTLFMHEKQKKNIISFVSCCVIVRVEGIKMNSFLHRNKRLSTFVLEIYLSVM